MKHNFSDFNIRTLYNQTSALMFPSFGNMCDKKVTFLNKNVWAQI